MTSTSNPSYANVLRTTPHSLVPFLSLQKNTNSTTRSSTTLPITCPLLIYSQRQPNLLYQSYSPPPSSIPTESHLSSPTNPSNPSTTTCTQLNTITYAHPTRVVTWSQNNIHKPKQILDDLAHVEFFIPRTFKQANQYPEWKAAMKAKFDALSKNQTWELVQSALD